MEFHNLLAKSDISVSADKKGNVLKVLILSSYVQENEPCILYANHRQNPPHDHEQTLKQSPQVSSELQAQVGYFL